MIETIWGAVTLSVEQMYALPATTTISWGLLVIVFCAGLSSAFGQSLGLFLGGVRSIRRYLLALGMQGFFFLGGTLLRGVSIYTCLTALGHEPSILHTIAIMLIATLPWLYGFFVFLPYVGSGIYLVLSLWSYAIIVLNMMYTFALPLWQGVLIPLLGWALLFVSRYISRKGFHVFCFLLRRLGLLR